MRTWSGSGRTSRLPDGRGVRSGRSRLQAESTTRLTRSPRLSYQDGLAGCTPNGCLGTPQERRLQRRSIGDRRSCGLDHDLSYCCLAAAALAETRCTPSRFMACCAASHEVQQPVRPLIPARRPLNKIGMRSFGDFDAELDGLTKLLSTCRRIAGPDTSQSPS